MIENIKNQVIEEYNTAIHSDHPVKVALELLENDEHWHQLALDLAGLAKAAKDTGNEASFDAISQTSGFLCMCVTAARINAADKAVDAERAI